MRCAEPSFNVIKPVAVDDDGVLLPFCAGKATWYPEMLAVFEDCRTALETGILPREGSLDEQEAVFVEVFPAFIERWRERSYERFWGDVRSLVQALLGAFGAGKGGGAGKRGR